MQADRHRRRIESHVVHRRMDAALAAAIAWCERSPSLLEPELTRARVELAADHYRAARERALRAVLTRDCPPELAIEVVNCLRLFVAHDALGTWAGNYPHWSEVAPADRARAAGALSAIAATQLARPLVDAAVADAPNDAVCLVNRAMILSYAGEFEDAQGMLERTIRSAQNPAMAHWLLARLRRQSASDNHVERLRARIAVACGEARDNEYLHFALFKELDDLGEHEAAWLALEQGCRYVQARLVYDRTESERLFAALKQQFPLGSPPTASPGNAPVPIFILGMHRSGTTLVESILASHADVFPCGETQRLTGALRYAADHYCQTLVDEALVAKSGDIDCRQVGEMFLKEGRALAGSAHYITEKMPGNFRLIGFIRHALPQAKVVHVRRNAMDVCFANLRELFADAANYSYAMADVAHFHKLYEDLMRYWHAIYPGFVLDVDYEELVTEPAAVSRRIFEFCGLNWTVDAIDPARWAGRSINTLSAVQSRQRVSTSSIGRWKPYATWLAPLRAAFEGVHGGSL